MKKTLFFCFLILANFAYSQKTKVHFININAVEYTIRTHLKPDEPIKTTPFEYYILDIPSDSLGILANKKSTKGATWLKFDKKEHYFYIKKGLTMLDVEVIETTENTMKMFLRTYPLIIPITIIF